jgi:Leucine Rich repeat
VGAVFMSKLFGISDENLIMFIMSWLDLRDYGLLDSAITNVVTRMRWMICLSSAQPKLDSETLCLTHSLLRWFIKRRMQPEVITCCVLFSEIDDRSLIGIDNKLLRTLVLVNSKVTDAGLLMIAQGCPQLKDITLGYSKDISDKGLLALAVNLPGMTSIDLCLTSKATHVGVHAIAEHCPALVKISINVICFNATDSAALNDSILAIARGCPRLQTFSIRSCNEITDHSVASLAEKCKDLRSVCLHGCNRVTDGAIKAIANSCPDLEKLDIAGRLRTDVRRMSFISEIKNESFVVVGQKCSKLVDITIAYNFVTDIGIAALARGCPQLRSFSSSFCPSISTAGITALSHGCKKLRTIHLANCRRISDDCLFRIAEGCPELTSFNLSSSEAVTSAGISCIAGGCKNLLYITLKDCSQIDDTALIAIGSSCPNLLDIVIESSRPFSDQGLIAIACGCPALERISISYCPNITDAGVIAIAQKCFQLQTISLTSSKITDASLIAFVTNSRKLRRVTFNNCDCITSTGLSILAVECTRMQSMNFMTCKKVEKENLLSLRRKYLFSKYLQNLTTERNRPTFSLSNSMRNGSTENNHPTSLPSNSLQNRTTEHDHPESVISICGIFIRVRK